MGYHRAGFEVVGMDIKPQPRYPFEFIQRDVSELFDAKLGACIGKGYDAIHASPPCQAYSQSALGFRNAGKEYPDLLAPTREFLRTTGLPWVIENVPDAPMRADYILCGSQFGLNLVRHRWFEVSWGPLDALQLASPCSHKRTAVSVVGHGTPSYVRNAQKRYGVVSDREYARRCREAMGVDWMTRAELSQAIPPAYTEFIGTELLAALERAA